jgi:hypothetical protein
VVAGLDDNARVNRRSSRGCRLAVRLLSRSLRLRRNRTATSPATVHLLETVADLSNELGKTRLRKVKHSLLSLFSRRTTDHSPRLIELAAALDSDRESLVVRRRGSNLSRVCNVLNRSRGNGVRTERVIKHLDTLNRVVLLCVLSSEESYAVNLIPMLRETRPRAVVSVNQPFPVLGMSLIAKDGTGLVVEHFSRLGFALSHVITKAMTAMTITPQPNVISVHLLRSRAQYQSSQSRSFSVLIASDLT